MFVFDRINHKDDATNIPEEKSVKDLKNEILMCQDSNIMPPHNAECPVETFGIKTENYFPTENEEGNDAIRDAITAADAVGILQKVENSTRIIKSLLAASKSSSISYRQFPVLNKAMSLFSVNDGDYDEQITKEHIERNDNVLQSWAMKRDLVSKDGDCCFRAVARNICKIRNVEFNEELRDHLAKLELLGLNEDEMSKVARPDSKGMAGRKTKRLRKICYKR